MRTFQRFHQNSTPLPYEPLPGFQLVEAQREKEKMAGQIKDRREAARLHNFSFAIFHAAPKTN